MADNSYNIMVSNPVTPFTMSRSFKACSNGKIFIGIPDTDPTLPQNQIPVYVESESGTTVQVSQPIIINSAGYPVYNGQISKFVTTQNYSMAVYDSYMVQQFYWADLSTMNPEGLLQKIASPDGFKYVGYFDSVSSLASFGPGSDGDRVEVIAYHESGSTGGGFFVFDSSKSSVNDGVYCINGWIRDISSGEITDYDAGLVGMDGSDATTRLQALLEGMPDNFEFKCYGEHEVSSPLYFLDKSNIKITGPGRISAKKFRDSWTWIKVEGFTDDSAASDDGVSGYPMGVLNWANCSHVKSTISVNGGYIRFTADTNNVARKREYGTNGIYFFNSPYSRVHGGEICEVWGWGVIGVGGSHYSEVKGCRIHHTTMQSGVNITAGNSHVLIDDNDIYNCGLYGIECENFSRFSVSQHIVVTNNRIDICKWMVEVVGPVETLIASGNIGGGHYFGLNAVGLKDNSKSIVFSHNTVNDTIYPLHSASSQNVSFDKNVCFNARVPDYVVYNQYSCILYIDPNDRTKLRMPASATFPSMSVQINGTAYTISGYTLVTDANYTYGEASYREVVMTSALGDDVLVGMTLMYAGNSFGPVGMATSLLQQSTTNDAYVNNVFFTGNIIKGAFTALAQIVTTFADTSKVRLSFTGNNGINLPGNTLPFYRIARNGGFNAAIEWRDNDVSNGVSFSVPARSGDASNFKAEQVQHFSSNTAVASGGVFKSHHFYIPKDRLVIGVDVVMQGVSSGSNISLNIDGVTTVYPSVFTANSTSQTIATFKDRTLTTVLSVSSNSGRHYLQLYTSGNTAAMSSYDIYIYLL